jgi:hypothetical protein
MFPRVSLRFSKSNKIAITIAARQSPDPTRPIEITVVGRYVSPSLPLMTDPIASEKGIEQRVRDGGWNLRKKKREKIQRQNEKE